MIDKKVLLILILSIFTILIVSMTATSIIVEKKLSPYESVIINDLEIMEENKECHQSIGILPSTQDLS